MCFAAPHQGIHQNQEVMGALVPLLVLNKEVHKGLFKLQHDYTSLMGIALTSFIIYMEPAA